LGLKTLARSPANSITALEKNMSDESATQASAPTAQAALGSRRRLVQITATFAWWIGSLFVSAGRLNWVQGWISVALSVIGMTAVGLLVRRYNPSLMDARAKWRHKDTKSFDKVFLALYLPLVSIQPAVAGLDAVRFRWSSISFGFVYIGSILFAMAIVLIGWVMAVNPYAETSVRIQTDRGHCVVTSGPYRIVRHPMYVGAILMYLGTPLVWGSVWALVLGALIVALLIWRTAREDSTLRQELSGYEEFTTRTRYRLFPGLW
jgi:protein-S-isoprenylcysteine O-methyltransferase Ste14